MPRRARAPRGAPRRRGAPWIAAAAALAVVAAILTGRAAAGRPSRDAVLVARVPIAAGTVLDSDTARGVVGPAPVPEGLRLSGLVRDLAAVGGRPTVVALSPGEPLTEAALGGMPGAGPAPLAPGERAIPVPTALAGVASGALRPGVRVDVLASGGDGGSARSSVVVADAEVLVAGSADPSGVSGDWGSALLRVRARDALRLAQALDVAREVRIVIRPFGEGAE